MLIVHQDGREFYSSDPSVTNPIYTAPIRVPDGDMRMAYEARKSFEIYMSHCCPKQEWRWEKPSDLENLG